MATALQCPNPSCGRMTQLGDDPLGRIFRCPRCLTKLPSTATTLPDSGWTKVLGSLPRRSSSATSRVERRAASPGPSRARHAAAARFGPASPGEPALESGEFWAAGFESRYELPDDPLGDVRPGESGDFYVPAFADDERPAAMTGLIEISREVPRPERVGRFEIQGLVGEGRHSSVYRASDPLLERQVALKIVRNDAMASARALERFLGEARALAQIHHPRIVRIYEAGRDGETHYIAMELIEGQTLAERIAEGPLPFRRAAEIVAELAEALAYTHGLGIVHRDIKPANVRLDARGTPCLMDFGIAYRPESGEVPVPPGVILGTPAYIAPEQARGGQADVLPASDQYSLGAVFYELLCGKPPFLGPPPCVLFHAIHHDPVSPRSARPDVPRPLDAICRRAMAKNPARRYPSCHALAGDLRSWLRERSPQARRRSWSFLSF